MLDEVGPNIESIVREGCKLLQLFSRKNLPTAMQLLEEWLFNAIKEREYDDIVRELIYLISKSNEIDDIEYVGGIIHLLIINYENDLSRVVVDRSNHFKNILNYFSFCEYYGDFEGRLKNSVIEIYRWIFLVGIFFFLISTLTLIFYQFPLLSHGWR